MAIDTGDGLVLRVCDLCGAVDDHPRHVIGGPTRDVFDRVPDEIVDKVLAAAPEQDRGRLLRDLLDTGSSDRHLQCCAAAGCPETRPEWQCGNRLQGAEGLTGADLRAHFSRNAENPEG